MGVSRDPCFSVAGKRTVGETKRGLVRCHITANDPIVADYIAVSFSDRYVSVVVIRIDSSRARSPNWDINLPSAVQSPRLHNRYPTALYRFNPYAVSQKQLSFAR